MSTRAAQIEILLAGIRDASTGELVPGGVAYFYEAGTTNPKNVWTEKEKTNPYTSYTLSAIGTALLYGDGIYKINVLDSDSAQVSGFPRDNVKVRAANYYLRAASATISHTSDDDFIEVNTTATAVTINLLPAASWIQPLKVMHTAGGNAITLEPSGAETIDGDVNYAFTAVGTIVEVVPNAAGTALRKAGIRSVTQDADGDTKIQVEESPDEDKVRIDTGGTQRVVIDSTGVTASVPFIGEIIGELRDADDDTKVQVQESADEDKVRVDTAGVERAVIDSSGLDIKSGGLLVAGLSMIPAISGRPLFGDTVAGRRLRLITLAVSNGTDAASLTLQVVNIWNGENVAPVNNIADATVDTYFDYINSSDTVALKPPALGGTPVAVLAATIILNSCGANLVVDGQVISDVLNLRFYQVPDNSAIDVDVLVDSGQFYVRVLYLTED